MNLKGDARLYFENVQGFQGFEAWRKIMKLVRNRSEVRKLSLHDKVQRLTEAKKLSEAPAALETWDTDADVAGGCDVLGPLVITGLDVFLMGRGGPRTFGDHGQDVVGAASIAVLN